MGDNNIFIGVWPGEKFPLPWWSVPPSFCAHLPSRSPHLLAGLTSFTWKILRFSFTKIPCSALKQAYGQNISSKTEQPVPPSKGSEAGWFPAFQHWYLQFWFSGQTWQGTMICVFLWHIWNRHYALYWTCPEIWYLNKILLKDWTIALLSSNQLGSKDDFQTKSYPR